MSTQLASLVPTFDPATDDLLIYQQKVELVLAAWPPAKIPELITRLILGCKGTAFQKLQIHQTELLKGDAGCVQKLVEYLGGSWGKIALERQYEDAEQALYHTVQKSDEANDSYLARADVMWSRLLARKMTLAEIQAYVVLRGSQLTTEEKKRVIMDSEVSGTLTMKKVHEAIRVLGASFFNEMTGRKSTRTKVYDTTTLTAESSVEPTALAETETAQGQGDQMAEDEFLELLVQEGDGDALLIADFEAAAQDTIQEDSELATAFSAYQQARHRLSEKFRNRGFFPARPYAGKGKGYGKQFGRGKGHRPRKTLQERIMTSTCRICEQPGHWKAERPLRNQGSANSTEAQSTAPTSTVITTAGGDSLPLEFLDLPETTVDEPKPEFCESFVCESSHVQVQGKYSFRGRILGESRSVNYTRSFGSVGITPKERLRSHVLRTDVRPLNHTDSTLRETSTDRSAETPFEVDAPVQTLPTQVTSVAAEFKHPWNTADPNLRPTHPICFATHDAFGVLDLGASKTVIGSEHVKNLIQSLNEETRKQLTRCSCQVTFKFGNQGTLNSQQAIVVPIGKLRLKIAIVPGGTPFLISNTFMRAIKAKIDCELYRLTSPMLHCAIPLELTERGLFLLNLNDVVTNAKSHNPAATIDTKFVETTFLAAQTEKNIDQAAECPAKVETTVEDPLSSSTETPTVEAEVHRFETHDMQQADNMPSKLQVQDLHDLCERIVHDCHVSHQPSQGLADRGGGSPRRFVPADTCRAEDGSDILRTKASGGAWMDQGWINFMVSKYGNSKVLSHRRLIRFVELMVEQHEQQNVQVPALPPPESIDGGYAMIGEISGRRSIQAKAKARSTIPSGAMAPIPLDPEEELEFEMYNQGLRRPHPSIRSQNSRLSSTKCSIWRMLWAVSRSMWRTRRRSQPRRSPRSTK